MRGNWHGLAAVCLILAACSADDDETAPQNKVSFMLDGAMVEVESGLAFALIDATKNLLGPNTHLYFEAGKRSTDPARVLGDKLRINLPADTMPGSHPVRYSPLPGKSNLWVQYRVDVKTSWVAFDGALIVDEAGGIGSRFRARFDELKMTNTCGEERSLTGGFVDVRVGSEDAFPVTDVGPGSEWSQIGASAMLENNLIMRLDDKTFACEFPDYTPTMLTGAETESGRPEQVLSVIAICSCGFEANTRQVKSSFSLIAQIPSMGEGTVVPDGKQYFSFILVDVNNTPMNFRDDEHWYAFTAPRLHYRKVSAQVGAPVDIALDAPLTYTHVDLSGPDPVIDRSRTRTLSKFHAYGFVGAEQ